MRKPIVMSLGGSLIVPDKVDPIFLEKFKKTLRKNYGKYKFIVVCGGGSIARKYIKLLEKQGKSRKEISLAGIRATRMNAKLLTQIFGKEANENIPKSMKEVKDNIKKNKVVFCGALRYAKNETSDGTAAKLAGYLNSEFINITNVDGLYTSNPKEDKNANFIASISWKDFEKMALKIKYRPGQHFVLDQNASIIIKRKKIKTYIIGQDMRNLDNFLRKKKFKGTTISDGNNKRR